MVVIYLALEEANEQALRSFRRKRQGSPARALFPPCPCPCLCPCPCPCPIRSPVGQWQPAWTRSAATGPFSHVQPDRRRGTLQLIRRLFPSAGSRQRRRQVRQTPPPPDQRRASQVKTLHGFSFRAGARARAREESPPASRPRGKTSLSAAQENLHPFKHRGS